MKLCTFPITLTSSALILTLAAACSDAGGNGAADASDPTTASDAGSSSSQNTKDGGSSGGGNKDAGGGSVATDAGATTTDAGTVMGSCKKINDGMYTVVQTGVSAGDVDASGTLQTFCGKDTSMVSYPAAGAVDLKGCVVTSTSQDGCTTNYDCTQMFQGITSHATVSQTINADGNGFTTTFVAKWTQDSTGMLELDCTLTKVGTRD